jgi:hypothetical protein
VAGVPLDVARMTAPTRAALAEAIAFLVFLIGFGALYLALA